MKLNLTQHNYNMKNKEEIANKHGILSGKDSELDDAILKAMQEYANQCQEDMADDSLSDEVLFEQATVAMEEHYGYGCETEIDAYFRGLKWMQKQLNK